MVLGLSYIEEFLDTPSCGSSINKLHEVVEYPVAVNSHSCSWVHLEGSPEYANSLLSLILFSSANTSVSDIFFGDSIITMSGLPIPFSTADSSWDDTGTAGESFSVKHEGWVGIFTRVLSQCL